VLASLGAVLQFPFEKDQEAIWKAGGMWKRRHAVCFGTNRLETLQSAERREGWVHARRAHVLRTILGYPMTTAGGSPVLKIEMNTVGWPFALLIVIDRALFLWSRSEHLPWTPPKRFNQDVAYRLILSNACCNKVAQIKLRESSVGVLSAGPLERDPRETPVYSQSSDGLSRLSFIKSKIPSVSLRDQISVCVKGVKPIALVLLEYLRSQRKLRDEISLHRTSHSITFIETFHFDFKTENNDTAIFCSGPRGRLIGCIS